MQNSQNKPFFKLMRVLILISGILGILISIVAAVAKLQDGDATKLLVLIAAVLGVACGIIEIIGGITSFSKGKRAAVLGRGSNYAKAALAICIIQLVLSLANGIMEWQLGTLFVTGIVIPILFMFSSKKSRSGKQMRGRVNATRN